MSSFTHEQLLLIKQVLHDATLEELHSDRSLATLQATFKCLRLGLDGSELNDKTVQLTLTSTRAVGVGYDHRALDFRPSEFEPPQRITAKDLLHWRFRAQEAILSINSPLIDDALDSARFEWLAGDEIALRNAAFSFCLMFESWCDFGRPMIRLSLLAAAESFTITSGGVPLALDDWEKQFAAWWQGWRNSWQAKDDAHEYEPGEFDTGVPPGLLESPDLDYQPPPEPVFHLDPTDVPREILLPIRDWFESHHKRDWLRMARVFRTLDTSVEKRAKQLAKMSNDLFGRWGYARSVDQWWVEGKRACAVLRGIEHTMPLDGDLEENSESVWTFALRKRQGSWMIDSFSQGWPRFKSAKRLSAEQKPWLKLWESGEVK